MSRKTSDIGSIPRGDFVSVLTDRLSAIGASVDAPVRDLSTYPANRLAAKLHPHVQFLKVKETVEHSPDMKSYLLEADKAKGTRELAWFSAGQYLSVALSVGGQRLCRPYSIASAPGDTREGVYRITVKRVEGGLASGYILDNWAVGTEVTASAPLGEFTYEPLRDAKTVVGVAGGSGITPFRSFARAIVQGDEDFSLILLYGSRTMEDAVFTDEFKAMTKADPRIKIVNVLSEEKKRGCPFGFIDAKRIRHYAPTDEPYSVFLCGPQAMYSFVDKELEKLPLRRKFIRHELFGEYFHPEKNEDYPKEVAESYRVTVRMNGTVQTVDCPSDTTLLRAMEAAGILAPSDCRSGRCGWCRSQLISGDVYVPASVDGRREADKLYGYIHPCCTFPLSDVEIEVPPMPG